MEKFVDRLEAFMNAEGINDNQLTVKANLSVGLIGKCKKDRKGMASDSIEKILLAYPSLSADWLLTGRGEMFVGEDVGIKDMSSLAINGNGSGVITNDKEIIGKFLSIIEEKDRQIARLIEKL